MQDNVVQPTHSLTSWQKYLFWIFSIFVFGSFVRLMFLGNMAYHHDESIHAQYSYYIFRGDLQMYKYDPVYHGPFLYHITALFFLLFGDNDFTGRLPMALSGIFMLYLVWRLRPWLGNAGTLATMLLVAISPSLTYFSRFARNDVFMCAWALGIVVCALEYLRSRNNKYLVGMTVFLTLMYATKENSYMTGFFLGSFIVFYGIYYIWSYPREARNRALAEIFVERGPFVKIVALYGIYSCIAFSLVRYVAKKFEFASPDESHNIAVLRNAWTQHIAENSWIVPTWTALALILIVGVFIGVTFIQKRVYGEAEQEKPFFRSIAEKNVWVLVSIFVALLIYSVLFTTLGTNPSGVKAGMIDYLLYWMGQQGSPRIAGPPDYFIVRLLIYEILPVLVALIAFCVYLFSALRLTQFIAFIIAFIGTVYAYWHLVWENIVHQDISIVPNLLTWLIFMIVAIVILFLRTIVKSFSFVSEDTLESLEAENRTPAFAPDGFRMFLIYWSVLAVLIYAMLNEKVPWLTVHMTLPLTLLAGVFIGDLWDRFGHRAFTYAFLFVVGILTVYQIQTNINLNFYRSDDPRELMIYTQTGHYIHDVLEEIQDGGAKMGAQYLPPNPTRELVALQDGSEVNWPYVWYLRKYRVHTMLNSPSALPPSNIPFVITDTKNSDKMKIWGKGQYTRRIVRHRLWWPPPRGAAVSSFKSELPFDFFKSRQQPSSRAWKALWRYLLYREVWDVNDPSIQPSSTDALFYAKSPLLEPEAKPQVMPGYDQPPKPLSVLGMTGRLGSAEGDFNQPRGVALSPDGTQLYVLDALNARVQVFNTDLHYIGYFGGPGSDIGQFMVGRSQTDGGPNGGIDVGPDGTIYVTDTWAEPSGRINRYRPDGTPLTPLFRPANEPFFFPRSLTVAPDGTLFVSDTGNRVIVKFAPDGRYLGIAVQDALNEPVGLAVGPDNLLYICDVGNQRIAVYNMQGQPVRSWNILGWSPDGETGIPWITPYITVDGQGWVYVSDSTTHMIQGFDSKGARVVLAGGKGSGQGYLTFPRGLDATQDGILFIADSMNHRIVKATLSK